MVTGKCQCGAIRYEVDGQPAHSAICHCADCRASSGAPMVGWALFEEGQVRIEGEAVRYQSSELATRHFCGTCGTGLFYTNPTIFPGGIDIQTSTLDDPDSFPPQAHIQLAEAQGWVRHMHDLPKFDRFPGEE
ncbi:GFA family protein [Sphingobium sp. HBC34]|uniref:GFA family protein n=1 Tax=Sphingobium cyanobacteriorum TaxID=3063954 RepID=A0ABT8ZH90_9SPHN|nr:GFA family protein [Sphingobium sp. HBC34]MDO7833513.1 GFA family protein [Sphingobium sp. HBC34]